MDKKLAQRKHFPSVNWSISYSNYERILEPFYDEFDGEYITLRSKMNKLLSDEADL